MTSIMQLGCDKKKYKKKEEKKMKKYGMRKSMYNFGCRRCHDCACLKTMLFILQIYHWLRRCDELVNLECQFTSFFYFLLSSTLYTL